MPIFSKYAQIRTPVPPEANAVPADLAAMVDGFDRLVNLQAVDEADRDARYGDVPAGTLVSLTTRGQLTWKGLDGWQVVSRRPLWLDNAVATTSDWSPSRNEMTVSSSGVVQLHVTAAYEGPTVNVPADGNIANILVGTIDPQYAPVLVAAPMSSTTSGPLVAGSCDSAGTVRVGAVAPNFVMASKTLQLVGVWSL